MRHKTHLAVAHLHLQEKLTVRCKAQSPARLAPAELLCLAHSGLQLLGRHRVARRLQPRSLRSLQLARQLGVWPHLHSRSARTHA